MQFNCRNLAVSGSFAVGFFFAEAALQKLAFIESQMREWQLTAGALMELTFPSRKAIKKLTDWFGGRGYVLRVLRGDGSERNGVAIFYTKGFYREVDKKEGGGMLRVADRVARLRLRRLEGSSVDIIAAHGKHSDDGFEEQMAGIEAASVACSEGGLLLADIGRLGRGRAGSRGQR